MPRVVIQHPPELTAGMRILMRTLRAKDGGKVTDPDRVAEHKVSRSVEEYNEILTQMLARCEGQERIYSTADARDTGKAIRIFKQRQLDADYYDPASKESFYIDIYNRWISALASPQARIGTTFLVDVDGPPQDVLAEITKHNLAIIHCYPTKNGTHFLLHPFNPNLVTFDCKKNAMLLVSYNSED